MAVVALALITILVFLFVLEPFTSVRKLPNRFITRKQIRKKELIVRKEYMLDGIRDLDLDHATGMIPEDDYQKMRKVYGSRLETISRELDGLSKSNGMGDIEKRIEADVKIKRRTPVVRKSLAGAVVNAVMCSKCSGENLPNSNFCSHCGAKLL